MQNIRIKLLYADGSPAAGEAIHIGYGGMEEEMITRADGTVEMEDIPDGISIYFFQLADDQKHSQRELITDGSPEYELKIDSPGELYASDTGGGSRAMQGGPMVLQFVDPTGELVPNLTVELLYDGKKQAIRSDKDGKIVLRGVVFGKMIEVLANGYNLHFKGSFQHQENIDCHLIPLRKSGWKLW